ncbi:efflux transporter outer membrane subunit [Viridibacterium curvum]|uniref:Multidrug efflux MFS transporter outer membrane subunit VceC n=1 Tax=Viridibacterium curvum TaxID=1101404 RepID=A0ABP9QGY9_9RHOO
MPSPQTSLPRLASLAAIVLLAAGCAQVPQLPEKAALRGIDAWAVPAADTASARTWPTDAWWTSYGDAQLGQLIDEALRGAPDMRAAQARLLRARAGTGTAQAATRPSVSANGSVSETKQSYNYLTPRSMSPEGYNDYGRLSLDFSWELDLWGKNRAALAASRGEEAAAAADVAQAQLVLSASIASTYAELARLYAARDTTAEALNVREKTEKLFRERQANGLETLGSLRQAESRRAATESELLSLDEQIALQRHQIVALMGQGPERAASIQRPGIRLENVPGLPGSMALDLLGRRPDVVAARLRAEAAAQRIDAAKADFYPNVNLSAYIGLQALGLDKLFSSGSDIGSVGPAISLPIFNSGRLKAQYTTRRADYDEAVANYDATVTRALQDVANAATSQQALTGQLNRTQAAAEAARQAWQIARNRYEGGLSNYLDVLTAEDSLLTALRNVTDLQSRAFTLDVSLIRALGGGYRAA